MKMMHQKDWIIKLGRNPQPTYAGGKGMERIVSAYRRGKDVRLELRIRYGYRTWRRVRGRVIGEQKHYILLQMPYYRECIGKNDIKIGYVELLNLTIDRGLVA